MNKQKLCSICGTEMIKKMNKTESNIRYCDHCRDSDLFLLSDWLPEVELPYDDIEWDDIA
jgi:hypothetical protein